MTVALNALESAVTATKAGRASMAELLRAFVAAEVHVPSGSPVWRSGAGFRPLIFDRDGTPMLACFSDLGRVGELERLAPYCLNLSARSLLTRLPRTHGLALNPGQPLGFEIGPPGLRRVIADFL